MLILGWFLIILAVVLAADAIMALLFRLRYLRWVVSFLPGEHREIIEQWFAGLPRHTLTLLALTELALAVTLHWLGWNLI